MADIQEPIVESPAETPGVDPSAISDPRFQRLAELERFYSEAAPIIDRLRPYEEDLKPLLEDEGYREFQRTSRKSYYQMLEEQKRSEQAAIPPEQKFLLDEFDKRLDRFKPVLEDYDARAQAQARAATEAKEKFTRENLEYAQRLVAEQKLTSDEVADLGRYAKVLHDDTVARGEPRFVSLEEAYKRLYGRAEAKAAPPVPRSLRAKSGATGVPGASKPAESARIDMAKPGNFTNEMLRRLNAQRKTG